MRNKIWLLAELAILLLSSCTPARTTNFNLDTLFEIPLGNTANVFHVSKIYDPGPRVKNFILEFQFRNIGDLNNWPGGVSLWIEDMAGNMIADYAVSTPGYIVTRTFTERPIRIVVSSSTSARVSGGDFDSQARIGGMLRLQITRVRGLLSSCFAAPCDTEPVDIPAGEEIIMLRTYSDSFGLPEDYNWYRVQPADGLLRTMYVSPFAPDAGNALRPRLVYRQGVPPCVRNCRAADAQSSIEKIPEAGDTGIYEELPEANTPLYLAVTTPLQGHVLLTVQDLKQVFPPVIVEMDETLNGGEAFPWSQIRSSVFNDVPMLDTSDVFLGGTFLRAYANQVNDFIPESATYPERIREMLVFAAARSLAGTEGLLRFHHFDIFHSVDPFRNTDLSLQEGCDRAEAIVSEGPFNKIILYLNEMNNPERGGATLLHEWGHYDFHYPDEYRDSFLGPSGPVTDPIDPNSVMGTGGLWEFCSVLNHRWDVPPGANPNEPGNRSVWEILQEKYGVLPGSERNGNYPQNQGTYYDVLHKLESLLEFNDVENPNPTPDYLHSSCRGCGDCLAGEACEGRYCTVQRQVGEECTRNEDCARGRRCDSTRSPNMCIPDDQHGMAGQYCTNNAQCRDRNCVGVTSILGGVCAAPGGIGARCETGAGCEPGLACDPNHRCSAGPNGAADGQYCSNTNQCSTSSYCTSPVGICKRKLEVPNTSLGPNSTYSCASNEQCLSNYCDTANKRCYPAQNEGKEGDFCVRNENCAVNHQCVMQTKSYGFCN